jgi:hypothetical protein
MNKFIYLWKIVKDRWLRPYDDIILRFNTKAEKGSPLIWRVFINGNENLASGFEIFGHIYDVMSYEKEDIKFNVGCKGRVRWEGTKAIIITAKKIQDIAL